MAYWGNMSGNIQEMAKTQKVTSDRNFFINYLLSYIPGKLINIAGKIKGIMNSNNKSQAEQIHFS